MAGRPSSFKTEYIEQAYKLCLLGATDKQMCDFFGVNEKTFNNWKHKHPEFLQSLKNGKEIADSQIAKSLFNRAKGYSCKATKFATFNGKITDREEYIENYPPDTTACIFWLKNRQPEKWRDKQDMNIDAKGINIVVGSDEDKELLEGI